MTDSNLDNPNNGEQADRPQTGRPAPDGSTENGGKEERPAQRADGGNHWYNQYKRDESDGDEHPKRPYGKDDHDGNASGGGRSFRPFRRDDNTSGSGRSFRPFRRGDNASGGDRPYRPYRPYNRDGNAADGGDRPYRPYRPYNRDENGNGGDRPYRPYRRDDNAADGGDRPYRPYKRFNRDENGTEGGDRPYRPYKRFNRDENGAEGGDRPYRPYKPYKRDDNAAEGGDRPSYRRPFNRDENNAEGGDRPYRPYKPYKRDDNAAEGGDRPYRRPFNRDENGAEGGDRPYRSYRRPFNRDENGASGGDRPYRRPFNRDENGAEGGDRPFRRFNRFENGSGGDRPYRRPFNRDENNTEGGDRPYRRPFNRDENGSEGGDHPARPPRRFGDRFDNRKDRGDDMSERSVIDSNRKDDIAISGDRPYRPYSPYLMEDENGVMHASYRPFKKSYELDADGIAHPPRKTEGQEGEESRPPRRFGDRGDATKDADKATWTFSSQDEKTDDAEKQLPAHDDGDELKLEENLPAQGEQPVEQEALPMDAAAEEAVAAEAPAITETDQPSENAEDSQESEKKDDESTEALPPRNRFGKREGDGFDRPPRRFNREEGDGFDRPPRRFNREEGDGSDRPPRQANEAGGTENSEDAEPPLPYARKQRIAVFGGSFDPIHNGHLLIAQKVLDLDKADEVLFVPALQPPHKFNGLVATPEQRLEMLRLALDPLEKVSFTDVELQRGEATPSYTFDTMAILKQIYSACELFLLIGMDSLVGLHSWYRASELVTRGKFIIYPRPGVERPPIYELEKEFGSKNAYKLYYSVMDNEELAQSEISSTTVREAAAQHLSLEKYVPQAVAQYIHDNNIYS